MDRQKKIAIISFSTAIIFLLALFLISYLSWAKNYQGRLPPNTLLGPFVVGGLNRNEVLSLITEKELAFRNAGIIFQSAEKKEILPLLATSLSPDIPNISLKYADAVKFNLETTLNNLFNDSARSFLKYLFAKFFRQSYSYPIVFSFSSSTINGWVETTFPELIVKPESAYFSLSSSLEDSGLINNPEKVGKEINWQELTKDLGAALGIMSNGPIILKTKSSYPEIKQADLEPLRGRVNEILNLDRLSLEDREFLEKQSLNSFVIGKEVIITWISPKKNGQSLEISFNQERIKEYLQEMLAPKINIEAVLPRFDLQNGKVSSWQAGKNGRILNLEESAFKIATALASLENRVALKIDTISIEELHIENDFNITELLGTGHSNFTGSPANRRHNIVIGAKAIHGMLIKPDEEFSLISALGNVDAAAGYLPELVIKGNKTIPEYGGGLCQVATTIFRSALATGLPITARRNHSYRVSYYEPAGKDAAIYSPWPDVKFINDTGNYILIQSRIEGDNIYFDFWGRSDGRIATTTDPVIYNIVKPPPTKFIETDELSPGEKRCTEKARSGADAYFDYIVIYPESATTTPRQEVRFRSHYVPWQEVCLIGKELPTSIESGEIVNEGDPNLLQ